jgi:MFS family permease
MLPVTAVDFCYGWTLWLFLSWIPSFFYQNYHQDLSKSAYYSAGVFLAGVVGDALGGVASDHILRRTGDRVAARRNVIASGMTGGFVLMIPVMLVDDVNLAALSLAGAFFFVELVVAPIWAVPMDIAPRYSGSASGMMNFGFGVAGIISPLVFGYLIDRTGSWTLPFAGSICLLLLGAGLSFQDAPGPTLRTVARGAVACVNRGRHGRGRIRIRPSPNFLVKRTPRARPVLRA